MRNVKMEYVDDGKNDLKRVFFISYTKKLTEISCKELKREFSYFHKLK